MVGFYVFKNISRLSKKIYRYFCLLFFQVYVEDKDGKVTRMEILEVKQKMGLLRKAVPTLPICIAILLFLINCVLPGIGKLKLLTVILGSKKLSQHKLQGFIWVIIRLRLLCYMNMKNNKKDHVFRSVTWSFCFSEANNKLFSMDNSNDFMDVLNVFVQLFVLIPPNSLPYAFFIKVIILQKYCKNVTIFHFFHNPGTFLGALSLFCGARCRHDQRSDGVKYGLVAAAIQLLTSIFIIGWIYSIYYGVKMIQDSSKGICIFFQNFHIN